MRQGSHIEVSSIPQCAAPNVNDATLGLKAKAWLLGASGGTLFQREPPLLCTTADKRNRGSVPMDNFADRLRRCPDASDVKDHRKAALSEQDNASKSMGRGGRTSHTCLPI